MGFFLMVLFIYLFIYLFRGEGREKERERNINVWLPLMWPPLGTWPITQACALTGNPTGDPMLNPLSYTSQGIFSHLKKKKYFMHMKKYKVLVFFICF